MNENKELRASKESYTQLMKSWLCSKYGRPANVADLYLRNIQRLTRLADSADSDTEAAYLKAIYGNLVTFTELEAERGVKIQKLEDHIYSNNFLSKLGNALPTAVRNKFIEIGDEDYSQIEGRRYMNKIIKLVKKVYTKAEITASATTGVPLSTPVRQKSPKAVHLMSVRLPGSSRISSMPNSNGTGAALLRRGSRLKKKRLKSSKVSRGLSAATVPDMQPAAPSVSPMIAFQNNTKILNAVLNQFAPAVGSQPMVFRPRNFAKKPRWACPLNGLVGHDLQDCLEIWEARTCKEQKEKMKGAACFGCLGRSQGCSRGVCAKMAEVPRKLICEECSLNQSRSPNNVLVCTSTSYKKPSDQSITNTVEKWIPGLFIARKEMFRIE